MNGKTVEDTYKKLTQLEHILKRPDSYIGSIDRQEKTCWVWDEETRKLEFRAISFVPGLYKIFDEILVNAADNYQRDRSMTYIKVQINPSIPYISVQNDGMGIPVQIHKDAGIYVAEMIFGELLTSSNYDDTEAKVVGGRNGYGAKLTNIYSRNFSIVTADRKNRKLLRKRWNNNMRDSDPVEIESYSGAHNFTRVEFEPDLKAFKMSRFDSDIAQLIGRRVIDIAGVSPSYVQVSLNGRKLPVQNFYEYFKLFTSELRKLERSGEDDSDDQEEKEDPEGKVPIVAHQKAGRWEVIASVTRSGSFHQVSFVNGISTLRGGTHVDYISEQIVSHALELAQKKAKKIRMSPSQVKGHLIIFVNCLIENPTFDSQTKETLTLKKEKFGSTCQLEKQFMKVLVQRGLVDMVVELAKFKEMRAMENKLNKGKRRGQLIVDKLEDANEAGGRKASQCTLILTEGDSAKALAMAGLEIVGRDLFGVYPLRGKMLNVRDASLQAIKDNKEIKELTDILGLQIGKTYHSKEERAALRYGHVMIMADQDQDGSHIKGLVINFISYFWPSLIHGNFFLRQFITPLLKALPPRAGRGAVTAIPFFTIQEYHKWARQTPNSRSYKIKYYKGLGTSTSDEGRDYFSELATHIIAFRREGPPDDSAIEMAFKKDKVADRKRWLDGYDEESYLEFDDVIEEPFDFMSMRGPGSEEYRPKLAVSFNDFVHKELIHFSMADTVRSIPSMCDGLKPGQRKIMFAVFKRKLTNTSQVKVAQLAGYVAEHTEYHHGEESLKSTIIGLAQDFVGSNNLNLLLPVGQFGTRNMGGKDHASARYIFTSLNKLTRILFHPDDDRLLKYKIEDGHRVEPTHYVPILPTVLINGSEGIGTGWSSTTPRFSPRELAEAFLMRLNGTQFRTLQPWYRGWIGEMKEIDPSMRKLKPGRKKKEEKKEKNQSIMSYVESEGRGMDQELMELDAIIREEYQKVEPEIVTHTRDRRYMMEGILERDLNDPERKILIKELPIRKWTKDYKHFLMLLLESNHQIARENKKLEQEKKVKKPKEVKKVGKGGKAKKEKEGGDIPAGLENFEIEDLREYHTEKRVHFMIVLTEESWDKISAMSDVELKERLKLTGSISLTNMVLFSPEGKLKHYHSVEEVCEDFFKLRLQKYRERHEMLLRKLKKESFIKSEKARFIREVNDQTIVINKKKAKQVKQILAERMFKPMEEIDRMFRGPEDEREDQAKLEIAIQEKEGDEEEEAKEGESGGQNYGYLLNMPIVSMTEERERALQEEKRKMMGQVAEMEKITSEEIWIKDINHFLEELDVYEEELNEKERIAMEKGRKNKRNQGGALKRKQSKPRVSKKQQPKVKEDTIMKKPVVAKPKQAAIKSEAPKWVQTKKAEKAKAKEENFKSIFESIKAAEPLPARKREQAKKDKAPVKKNMGNMDFWFKPQNTAKEEKQVKENIHSLFGKKPAVHPGVIEDSSEDELDI